MPRGAAPVLSKAGDPPKRRPTTSPWREQQDQEIQRTRKPPTPEFTRSPHDHLCIRETGNPDHARFIPNMLHCWCMCKQCWDAQTSRCTCSRCPCPRSGFGFVSFSMPLPSMRPSDRTRTYRP